MSKSFRLGSAVSLVALATVIAGCATPQGRATIGKAQAEVGTATRALMALNAGDYASAVSYGEQAVQQKPQDPMVRALLGNAYFGAGRFASAEAAYKDSLTLSGNQPQVVLKLALTQIAQGKNDEAVGYLYAARGSLDAADIGLALALAGRPSEALSVLEPAARAVGADARVRQNLALAYAFAGDWTNARTVAGQDVPADQIDGRIHQWMRLANPAKPSDQVAALIGITPAASDPGQPVQLALRAPETRQAQAAPVPAPQPQFAQFVPPPLPAPEPAPVVAEAQPPAPPPVTMAQAAAASPEAPAAFAAFVAKPPAPPPARKPAQLRRAAAAAKPVPVRTAAFRKGNSQAVVQLGAYRNAQWVATAWNNIARRHAALRNYTPMSARFNSPRGTFYRLSVKGFASDRDARLACESLRRAGASCFVRNVAGDAPVQIASR